MKAGRKPNTVEKFFERIGCPNENGCMEWNGTVNDNGRPRFKLGGKYRDGSRLAYELQYGPIPAGMNVCHTCDNGLCCNPEHLFLGTTQDNVADRVAKGRSAAGETHGCVKLTEDIVRQILACDYSAYGSKARAAKAYGISQSTLGRIVAGKNWRHVHG